MNTFRVVVVDVLHEQAPKVVLTKDDHVVEKLAANASNETLRGSVLPRASQSGPSRIHVKALNRVGDCRRQYRIVVIDHEPMGWLIGERLAELVDHPVGGWVRGDAEVEDFQSSVIDRELDVEQAKSNCWNDEEVYTCDHLPVIAEKSDPTLSLIWIWYDLWHVTRYGRDPDPNIQFP